MTENILFVLSFYIPIAQPHILKKGIKNLDKYLLLL